MKAYPRWSTLLPWLFLPTACAPHTSSGTVAPSAGDLPEVVIRRCGRQPGDIALEHASIAMTPIPGLDPSAPLSRITPENGLRAVCIRGNLRYATDLVPRVGWSENVRCVDEVGTTLAAFRAVVRAGDPEFCREPNP